jgi:alpha-beta hydrolase superfamily lysophospholipase
MGLIKALCLRLNMRLSPKSKKRVILGLPVYYLMVVVAMYSLQDYFIYYPEKTNPKRIEGWARDRGLLLWPNKAETYRGFIPPSTPQKAKGTVLVFHGNAGTALDRTYYVGALGGLGYRVVLAEYPGYGSRPGKPGENQFTEDAVESTRLAVSEFGRPLYLLGESLGCGVVSAAIAKTNQPIDGLALITPWDSLTHLALDKYWFLPVRWMLKDTYDNVANLANYHGPIAVVMAGQDEIIPNRLTRHLYQTLREPKRLWTFPNAGHNSWPSSPDASWWREMMNFLHPTANAGGSE